MSGFDFPFVATVDKDERGQEARVMLLLKKMLEKLVQFVRKVQLEEGRIHMQLKEAERQWSKSLLTEETLQEKSRKVKGLQVPEREL